MIDAPPTTLPAGYLLRNFRRVAHWVLELYPDLLSAADTAFHRQFQALSEPAQHLYLRLLTRTRPLIAVESLTYEEVPDVTSALTELEQAGFAELNPLVDATALLALQTKIHLQQWFAQSGKSSAKKATLVESILARHSAEDIHRVIALHQPFTRALQQDCFDRQLLLFFGNGRQDLSEFIITELGHVRYEPYRIDRSTRYFQSSADVATLQHYLQVREQLEDPAILSDAAQLRECYARLPDHRQQPELQRRFDRIVLTIARQLERLQASDDALILYRQVTTHPARERQARILAKQQQPQLALALCQQILADSHHPEELEFAEQFARTLARKTGTQLPLAPAPTISEFTLALPFTGDTVEIVAAHALSDAQHVCIYVENLLFCALFGLLFWDIIFAPIPGAFFHPFQRGPKHLHTEFFYPDRQALIESRLAEMNTPGWQQRIWHHFESRHGIANTLVAWEALSPELIDMALQHIPASHLQTIFRQLALHPGLYGSGFPDLIRFSHNGYELIEVKAPHDRLQSNQRRWFRRFAEAGIPARLLNVTWIDADNA